MHIRLISSAEILPQEILPAPNVINVLSTANYIFNNDAFIGARSKLLLSFQKKPECLIIDEVSKL